MASAASWLLLCLTTFAFGARLPRGEEPYRGQQAPGVPRTAMQDDQIFDLNLYSSWPKRETATEIHKTSDQVEETKDYRFKTPGDGDAKVTTLGGSGDNTDNEDDYGDDHYEEEYGDDDGEDDDDDDDGEHDIYLYVKDNDTSLLTFFNLTMDSEWELPLATEIEGDSTSQGPGKNVGDGSSTGEAARKGPYGDKVEQRMEYIHGYKADTRLPTASHDNVQRDKVVVLSGKQVKSLDKRGCYGCAAVDAKAEKSYKNNTLDLVNPSPIAVSSDEVNPGFYFEDDTPVTARTVQVNDEDIVHKKISDALKEYEGSNITASQEWKAALQTGLQINGWADNGIGATRTANIAKYKTQTLPDQDLNFKTSAHEINPHEEVYDLVMHSNQVSDEDKHYIATLEKLRRLVNKLGGLEAFHEKSQVHHIVKRQLSGTEACAVFSRRRRRAAGEAGVVGRGWRSRRGLSNVGKNLEQGNPRFRQLFNQYKTMCNFISLSVFEK